MNLLPDKSSLLQFLKTWWVSLILLPFVYYSLHQAYLTLNHNIFYSITYNFPFPVNFVQFILTHLLLIVHEAGHTFLGLFGNRTLTILGGSLYEVLLPAAIVAYFWFNRMRKSLQFSFYLLGTAWLHVAFYAADGGGRQLPLIGNLGKEAHDWYNLLIRWNLLQQDSLFGTIFVIAGAICFVLALFTPLWFHTYEEVHLDVEIK